MTDKFHGQKFLVRKNGLVLATPLLAVLVLVEVTDIIFAVDSIPAIFAVTDEVFLVFTANAFAILGLRAMYFLLADLIHRFIYLKIGLALVLIWVGIKMLLKIDIYYIPTPLSLGVIATILGVSIGASLWATRGQARQAPAGPAHSPFGTASAAEMAELEPLWRRGRGREQNHDGGPAGRRRGSRRRPARPSRASPSREGALVTDSPQLPDPPAPLRPAWTFLTNHGHVLLAVAADPHARVTDIAARVGITPRATLQILKDLEDSGYLHRRRDGRRTSYAIEPHQHFRHPAAASREIDGLIGLFRTRCDALHRTPTPPGGPARGRCGGRNPRKTGGYDVMRPAWGPICSGSGWCVK